MKAIPINTLSKGHEGLAVSFDCPENLSTDAGVPHAIMPDGSKRLLNTELEWRYHGRNDLEGEPNVGLFQHVHTGVWIMMHLDNDLYVGRMLWVEESPTERLIHEISEYIETLRNDDQVKVVILVNNSGTRTFNR